MSRRKQSNPKPCKHHSEGEEEEEDERKERFSVTGTENGRRSPSVTDHSEPSRLSPEASPQTRAETPTPALPADVVIKPDPAEAADHSAATGWEENCEFRVSPSGGSTGAGIDGSTESTEAGKSGVIPTESGRSSATPPDPAMFVSAEIKSEPGSPREGGSTSPRSAKRGPAAPFILMPSLQRRGMLCSCGINFSSLSTLAAHQKYYCTNRPNADDTPEPVVGGTEPVVSPDPSDNSTSEPTPAAGEPSNKKRFFACPQCSFTTDKANGLNRHMRIHVPPAAAGGDKERVEERYCRNCDIQFSSMKTYYVHKQYYCQTRIGKAGTVAAGSVEAEPGNTAGKEEILPAQQHMVALPTSPVLLVPYQVLQGASLVANPLPPGAPPTTCIVLPDGSVKPLSHLTERLAKNSDANPPESARTSVPSLLPFPIPGINATAAAAATGSSLDWLAVYRKRALPVDGDSPLDLTNKRLKPSAVDTDSEEEARDGSAAGLSAMSSATVTRPSSVRSRTSSSKPAALSPRPESTSSARSGSSATERERNKSGTPEPLFRISVKPPDTISEADSVTSRRSMEPVMPRSSVPVSETEVTATADSVVSVPSSMVTASSGVAALVNGASRSVLESWLTPGAGVLPPHVVIKQGPVQCPDCGTVFYKQENFEVHRLHYCIKRPVLKEERTSPATSPASGDSSNTDTSRFQFHCTACGTRFTSADTLHAHKAFYCTHREVGDPAALATSAAVAAAVTAATSDPGRRQSAPRPHPVLATGWKCPCCDVYSPTSAAAQKHLETHNNVRAFKCSLCGYKGNTLRGMRTHIRMHFADKKTPELPEESFISCIVANSDEEDNSREDRTEKCPLCAFKSGNPETMIKHFTLAHPRSRSRVSTAPSMIEHRRRASSGSPIQPAGATSAGKVSEKCLYCSFYTDSAEIMLNHQLFRHPEQQASPPSAADPAIALSHLVAQKIQLRSSSADSREAEPPSTSPGPEDRIPGGGETKPEVKQNGNVSETVAAPSNQSESLLCHHCNIVFKQMASYAAHAQFYCPGRSVTAARSVTPVQ